jgi:hypothetical protein
MGRRFGITIVMTLPTRECAGLSTGNVRAKLEPELSRLIEALLNEG